jgi:alanine-glyoxylate transaminase/serine-glyoxylate transaminase/serine-pyruvate transaminase
VSAIFGLAEGLRILEEEGIGERIDRHRRAGADLVERLGPLGFRPLVAEPVRLPQLTTVVLPPQVTEYGESALRRRLLADHDIEVGGGLGPLAGRIWRIGLMGENARPEPVDRLVEALEAMLGRR